VSNGSAGVTPSSFRTSVTADVMSADLTWPGVQSGCTAFTSADTPAACGLDIDVPAITWNISPGGPPNTLIGSGVWPARICMPGAVTSGFRNSPTGPRDEKLVMTSGVTAVGAPGSHRATTPVCVDRKSSSAMPGSGELNITVGTQSCP
jgi:hypothetical protein